MSGLWITVGSLHIRKIKGKGNDRKREFEKLFNL